MTNRRIKRASISLVIRKLYIKTMEQFHFTLTRATKVKNRENTKYW